MTRSLILDTDIGTDVDDCLALALVLASRELQLAGVTTVYGDVALRARIALELLSLRGIHGVPVAAGAAQPLLGKRAVYWEGHEGQELLGPEDAQLTPAREHAVDLIVHTVMENPGDITLVAIGPLTNIALSFLREPRLAVNLRELVIMGGVIGGAQALQLPWVEHNFGSDPEATHVVLSAGAPTRIVPLDVTTQVRISTDGMEHIRALGDPFHLAVADQIARYPRFAARGWTNLHDPLAVATLIDPSLVVSQPLHVLVETQGEHVAGQLLASLPAGEVDVNAHVALEVDAPRAERLILDRLAG